MTSFSSSQFVYGIDISRDDGDLAEGREQFFQMPQRPMRRRHPQPRGIGCSPQSRNDEDRSRAFKVDRLKPAIFALSLSDDKTKDGVRSILSDNTKSSANKLVEPYGLHIEMGMPYTLVVNKKLKGLMAVNIGSGDRVVITKSGN